MVNAKVFLYFHCCCTIVTANSRFRGAPPGYSNLNVPPGRNLSRDSEPAIRRRILGVNTTTTSTMGNQKAVKQTNVATNPVLLIDFVQDETNQDKIWRNPVDVAIQIQSIRHINEMQKKITIEIDLAVHWKDYGAFKSDDDYVAHEIENVSSLFEKYSYERISLADFENLWKPDIFIERVVEVTKPTLLASPILVRVIRNSSSVIYTTRASVQLDCPMNFRYYPADTQKCVMDIRSYKHEESSINLRWNPLPGAYLVDTNTDDNFDIQLSYVATRKKRVKGIDMSEAIFDVLQIQFSMRRRITYHLIQTYVPSSFLVFITWLSFLIPEDLIEARIGITMTTLLALTAMFAGVRDDMPAVSYVKAIDIWMVYCVIIVFATLLEFAVVVWLMKLIVLKRKMKADTNDIEQEALMLEMRSAGLKEKGLQNESSSHTIKDFEHIAKVLNNFAYLFFTVSFIIFCVLYWSWVLVYSGYYNWTVNPLFNGNATDFTNGFLSPV